MKQSQEYLQLNRLDNKFKNNLNVQFNEKVFIRKTAF